jgi:surfactin synthase thioesterase subunit
MLDMLIDAGGLSETVRGFPKWTTAMVALLRDDLALCRSHQPGDCARLPVPIHVFTGDADPMMSAADAEQWAGHSSIGYRSHVIPGGHFFNRESRPLLISAITAILFGQPITPS